MASDAVSISQDEMKAAAGRAAAALVQDGMRLGLGTGSTVSYFLEEVGRRGIKNLHAVPTSTRTADKARALGITLLEPFEDFESLDLAVDGADEVNPKGELIKGGGGAHLWEKLVALAAREFVVIVDETKLVDKLGKFPLPVEVVPFGWKRVQKTLTDMGGKPKRRLGADGQPFRTDSNNYLLDCDFGLIDNPTVLGASLKNLYGVVDSGLFIDIARRAIVGKRDGTTRNIEF
jgi:ribose 5-phosphate isomerase A